MAMVDETEEVAPKPSRMPLILGILLFVLAAGGGFYGTYSGILSLESDPMKKTDMGDVAPLPDIAFVALEPIVISLAREAESHHLRFNAHLEVGEAYQEEVYALMPRILDVLNSYLRAVEVHQLEDPSALIRLRAQMLRRVQIVTGEGRVRDLLITEFVLN
ncbi:MAG: flagellar basal body-associated FliL family protein [Pseudomonadota bacterium]